MKFNKIFEGEMAKLNYGKVSKFDAGQKDRILKTIEKVLKSKKYTRVPNTLKWDKTHKGLELGARVKDEAKDKISQMKALRDLMSMVNKDFKNEFKKINFPDKLYSVVYNISADKGRRYVNLEFNFEDPIKDINKLAPAAKARRILGMDKDVESPGEKLERLKRILK